MSFFQSQFEQAECTRTHLSVWNVGSKLTHAKKKIFKTKRESASRLRTGQYNKTFLFALDASEAKLRDAAETTDKASGSYLTCLVLYRCFCSLPKDLTN